ELGVYLFIENGENFGHPSPRKIPNSNIMSIGELLKEYFKNRNNNQ
ncbi:3435_t:CDS:1, partial [Entrophospora sp. SA101]